MNFQLNNIPDRSVKPRQKGLTMVMDKGLSLRQAHDLMEVGSPWVDLVKLGFGTSYLSTNLEEKINLYRKYNIRVYLGGTLFEAFYVRNQLNDYIKLVDKLKLDCVEISDGSIVIPHEEKCQLISRFAKNYTVLSEVGSKEEGILISPAKWIKMMHTELQAGSWKVIAEARESGTVGIYRPNGQAHVMLINKITQKINPTDILWEAPKKAQQVYFIKHFGFDVNLGNIAENEVIPLECLRIGLRGDTFFDFLDRKVADKYRS